MKVILTMNDITMRDWFAGQIAASMVGGYISAGFRIREEDMERTAELAFAQADALLTLRECLATYRAAREASK